MFMLPQVLHFDNDNDNKLLSQINLSPTWAYYSDEAMGL